MKIKTPKKGKVKAKPNNPNSFPCGCLYVFGKWVLCPAHNEDLRRVLKYEAKQNDRNYS